LGILGKSEVATAGFGVPKLEFPGFLRNLGKFGVSRVVFRGDLVGFWVPKADFGAVWSNLVAPRLNFGNLGEILGKFGVPEVKCEHFGEI